MSRAAKLLAILLVGVACGGPGGPDGDGGAGPGGATPSPSPSPEADQDEPRPAGPPPLAWVAVEDRRAVALVDVRNRRVRRTFDLSGRPHNITADGRFAAVSLPGAGRIALIRDGDVREFDLGGAPHDVKLAGRLVVVANEGASRLDLVARWGRRAGSIPVPGSPHDVAITADGRRAWVSINDSDELAVVDLDAERVIRTVPTGARPHDLLFAPDGRLWVTDWDGRLLVLSRNGEVLEDMALAEEAHHLTFDERGRAWITDHGAHRVFVLEPDPVRVIRRLSVPGAPHHVAIVGRWAAVADHDRGALRLYRVGTGEAAGRVPVGDGPHGVWAA